MPRLPEFLIIGAMKAGTTTLYRDLERNPEVFLPFRKEPSHLARDEVLTPAGRDEFARFFRRARAHQKVGVASTQYAKLPDLPGVPERARRVLGPDLRVIYLVREPVARIISQHRHDAAVDLIACGIDEAVRTEPRFINYSLYAMQIEPWIETFGRQRVLILQFETFVRNRLATVEEVSRFIGVTPRPDLVQAGVAYNESDRKRILRGPLAVISRNVLYKKLVSPYIPLAAKEKLQEVLLPKAPPAPAPPSPETVALIRDKVRDDAERLRKILGRDEPLWDLSPNSPGSRAGPLR